MTIEVEVQVNEIARRQGGHVTRQQLRAAGWSSNTIRRRCRGGLLLRVGSRTFRLGSVAASPVGDVTAACLDFDGVASHRTAAWLHGLIDHPRTIEVTIVGTRSRRVATIDAGTIRPRTLVHASSSLPSADVLRLGPTPVTSVARTLLGLGALVPGELTRAAHRETISRAVDRGLATDPWLWWLLSARRCRGRNGVSALEQALAHRAHLGPTESWLERHLLGVIEDAGLPLPKTQRVVRRKGRFAARVDFLYEPERVVVEALGYAFHRTVEQLDADSRRSNELQLAGFDVYQFTTRQILETPGAVLETIRQATGRTVRS